MSRNRRVGTERQQISELHAMAWLLSSLVGGRGPQMQTQLVAEWPR